MQDGLRLIIGRMRGSDVPGTHSAGRFGQEAVARGTGGSFATNVGGRMIGTSMAFVTTSFVAPMLAKGGPMLPYHVAMAAGIVGTGIAVVSFIVGFLLPEPKAEE